MIKDRLNRETEAGDLDRRIIAALQIDGRAGWRQIAAAIGAPERTVAAHGTELLQRGAVKVTAFVLVPEGGVLEESIVFMRAKIGMNRLAGAAVAKRDDTVFSLLTNGDSDCIFEVMSSRARMPSIILDELPAIPGVAGLTATTVIKLYKASFQWSPPILTDAEAQALRASRPVALTGSVPLPPLDREDLEISQVLSRDGRATVEELARATGLSPSSARRRFLQLQKRGRMYITTVVEPRVIGYPVLAILQIRTMPEDIEHVAQTLLKFSEIRHLAFCTGKYQLFAQIACATQQDLNDFLFRDDWSTKTLEIVSLMVIDALKHGSIHLENADGSISPGEKR